MPPHKHSFVELNYMLSGSCVQYVNNQRIVLAEGEILLLDKEIIQRIDPLGEKDILMNILVKGDSLTTEIIVNMVKSTGLVNEFLMNASKESGDHDKYIHFLCGNNDSIQAIIKKVLVEYFAKENYYMRSVNLLLSILMIELTRILEEESLEKSELEDEMILNILRYIEANFATLTLDQLAKHFGYHSNYISYKIKKETGRTFQGLINFLRYQNAQRLMIETDKTMEEITYEVGFQTISSLYKLFSKYTHHTPKEVKQRLLKNINLRN